MKLFRRKETLYGDLVKYSHKTALENPEMIDREYGHKIETLENEIKEHQKLLKSYSFEVEYTFDSSGFKPRERLKLISTDRDSYSFYSYATYRGYISFDQPKIMKFVDVKPEVLLQAVEHNKNLHVQIAEKDKQIKSLKKERTEFRKTYIKEKHGLI
jgi:hypothetical protein